MDYRVIGHETLELEFGNQKVPGFLQKKRVLLILMQKWYHFSKN